MKLLQLKTDYWDWLRTYYGSLVHVGDRRFKDELARIMLRWARERHTYALWAASVLEE